MKPVKMYVFKRDGRKEEIHFDKITSRIQKLCYGLNMDFVDPVAITFQVINGLYSGVTTQELDNLAAETAAQMTTNHADYAILAARIAVSNLHKETKKAFSDVISDLHNMINIETGKKSPMISEFHYKIVQDNSERLNSAIIYDRDFGYNYFGFKTLERSYLLKINGKIAERPQHMLMRVAVGIHGEDIDAAIETYNLLSERYFTHASPTLFAAATPRPQLSSCFLLTMVSDSIEGIFKSVEQCAMISKSAGGIGLNVHCIRAKGTAIAGTNGTSNGLVPMLRVFNNVARYVDQGGNKRPGAFAIYLEPWHSDIFEFLDLRKNTGKEENRARDLFYALWVPDLFMKRVEADEEWSLMCPHKCPGLDNVWGEEFEKLYTQYEKEGRANRTIKAQALWYAIIESQVETGTPYMLYKDACNRKSNQQNVGTIRCSNLCTEIVEYSSPDEIAVCNLASIALNMFVTAEKKYDFKKLKEVTKTVTKNLNKIIEVNFYPLPEAKKSNMRHRPIGIGVQGFADALILMRYPYESEESALLNQQIFETIYYGALEASCELAEQHGTYETYEGCPVSKGILQYDMWDKTPTDLWDWAPLKEKIQKHGVRNSLLLAPMPTASTAQILGNNESFEPYTSNIYNRRVLSGEFQVVNHHLLKDLTELDLWDEDMKNLIISHRGSIQSIEKIPQTIRDLYKTVWEISVRTSIQMAADRGAFIDQSQSFNIHVAEPNYGKLTSIHFFGWKSGLKTGMYYLRTKPAANAIQFTVDKTKFATPVKNGPTTTPRKTPAKVLNGDGGADTNGEVVEEEETAERDRRMAQMVSIANKVVKGLYEGVSTSVLDNLLAETAAEMTTTHFDNAALAGRIAVSKLHKETKPKFSEAINELYNILDTDRNRKSPIISDRHYEIVQENAERLDRTIDNNRDFAYNYFGFKTLERSYLLKVAGKVVERPQYMLMRVAIGIHGADIDDAIDTYNLLSQKYFTHASPTLFSAATRRPQMSSCFLLTMVEDSIEGIMQTMDQCAKISKSAGGVGLNIHCIRANGTSIAGTDGTSNGIVPMLRVFNNLARFVGQGVNKRPGSFAIYLEPWHADIFEFLDLKKNTGAEETRARDLFFGLWIPDLFMERLEADGEWSLMCPHKCPGLHDVWGKEFVDLYTKYENEGRATKTVKARTLWFAIIESQVETGTPYVMYKDACNRKSNQQNIGTIRCSNLCTEIVEYSSPEEIAVCNLASIALNMFVKADKTFDFQKLKDVTKIATRNLNKIIDVNYYPLPETELSNKKHRPIGIGVQGLADAYILMRYPYESDEAKLLNQQVFETIYYGALEASCELAEKFGVYSSYEGSPVSKGILQYDMWEKTPTDLWDWAALKQKIRKYGVRNSLLLAPMPTASTAQILGNNESFEPYTSNIYNRRVLSGEFQVVNHHLLNDLIQLDLWNEDMKNRIISDRGSIQNIEAIPKKIRDLYKTVWEISVKKTIEMAADRGAFIDQSQSFNIHVAEPNYGKLTSIHFYGWKSGLKTGMYYLRTKPAANAIQFTVDKTRLEVATTNGGDIPNGVQSKQNKMAEMVCSLENKDECLMCGS